MKARIKVMLKNGVLDPQGKAIEGALETLGFPNVTSVRQGKFFEVELDEKDPARARATIDDISKKLLANTVIENYVIEIDEK